MRPDILALLLCGSSPLFPPALLALVSDETEEATSGGKSKSGVTPGSGHFRFHRKRLGILIGAPPKGIGNQQSLIYHLLVCYLFLLEGAALPSPAVLLCSVLQLPSGIRSSKIYHLKHPLATVSFFLPSRQPRVYISWHEEYAQPLDD
jgi:hypothetical protein